jgi:hypothetical protein
MVVWLPLLFQVAIPLAGLAWLAVRAPSQGQTLLRAVALAAYLAAIAVAGLWLVVPWYLPLVYGFLLGAALVRPLRGIRRRPFLPRGTRAWLGAAGHAAFALLTAAVTIQAVEGRRPPADAVGLAFPLEGGTYLVANGGSRALVNGHFATLEGGRLRPYRGQSYGVDLVRVNAWGFRARGLYPRDPEAYAIYGDTVRAPCAGRVIEAVDGRPDLPPPETDRKQLAGNHVLLECGDVWVLLAHMRRASVRVRVGDSVALRHPLGVVGNSGNTSEPHLHIHAQRPGTTEAPLGGDPLPILLDGRFPARNARFDATTRAP